MNWKTHPIFVEFQRDSGLNPGAALLLATGSYMSYLSLPSLGCESLIAAAGISGYLICHAEAAQRMGGILKMYRGMLNKRWLGIFFLSLNLSGAVSGTIGFLSQIHMTS